MTTLYGSRLFGKVDEVPGLFHIATRFAHVAFLPIAPLESYVVFDGEDATPPCRVMLSLRSIRLAWLRALSMLATLGLGLAAWSGLGQSDGMSLAILFGLSITATLLLFRHPGFTRARHDRALQIAEFVGLSSIDLALLNDYFDDGGESPVPDAVGRA